MQSYQNIKKLKKRRILILGSSGNIGKNLYRYIVEKCEDYDIYGYSKSKGTCCNVNHVKIKGGIYDHKQLILSIKPDTIINCVGESRRIGKFNAANIEFCRTLKECISQLTAQNDMTVKVIHISSIGVKKPYKKHNPKLNPYEHSKLIGEQVISTLSHGYHSVSLTIIRPSIVTHKNSNFLRNLFLLLIILPVKIDSERYYLPIISMDELLKNIYNSIVDDYSKQEKRIINADDGITLKEAYRSFAKSNIFFRLVNR